MTGSRHWTGERRLLLLDEPDKRPVRIDQGTDCPAQDSIFGRCRRGHPVAASGTPAATAASKKDWTSSSLKQQLNQLERGSMSGCGKNSRIIQERCYGSQRFALVRLNADDDRSYRGAVDAVRTRGAVALQMENRATSLFERQAPAPAPQAPSLSDIVARDPYGWDDFDQSPEEASRAPSPMLRSAVV